MFASTVDYKYVDRIVVGRMLLDNSLMRIMHFMKGELVSLNGFIKGVHQGYEGFKKHQKENKARNKDIYWNHNVTGHKYINHQGSLKLPNRRISRYLIELISSDI